MSDDQPYPILRQVLAEHRPNGWAVEFGVWSGYSMGLIAEHMPVIGFDSFDGLPEDWRPEFPKGTFGPDDPRGEPPMSLCPAFGTMIVNGLFADTVSTFPFPELELVHIDCDLYSSTVTALEGITQYVDYGTVLVFDEYHGYDGWQDHEAKAFAEWCVKHKVKTKLIASGVEEAAFIIQSIHGRP